MHGNLNVEFGKWNVSKRKGLVNLAANIDRYSANLFNIIICEHQSVKTILKSNGIPEKRLEIIKLATYNKDVNVNTNRDKNKFIVLYTGTFVEVQNLELIYQTAKQLINQNIEFILIGADKVNLKIIFWI